MSLVNHVDVESYLRGMGGLLDPGWPPAALRARAIAARTYALRSEGASIALCDDDRLKSTLFALRPDLGQHHRCPNRRTRASPRT